MDSTKRARQSILAIALTIPLVVAAGASAQPGTFLGAFHGVINDFSPASASPEGPWEIGGVWSAVATGGGRGARFFAALTMVRSDKWVIDTGADQDDPSLRSPHAHHVLLEHGTVAPIANGVAISGVASITLNGTPAAFTDSPLSVELVGGSVVAPSNIRLIFDGAAAGHFGAQPLEGVVVQFLGLGDDEPGQRGAPR